MSTPTSWHIPSSSGTPGARRPGFAGTADPAESVARVALAKRELLLRAHRHRLRREDLEDCFSQATLELVVRARAGVRFAGPAHVQNALEQKFVSRILDRRRAVSGRSAIEAALSAATPVDEPGGVASQLADGAATVEDRIADRLYLQRLREVADELSADQRLLLACQVGLGMECAEFCARFKWSSEKFRKVAQRARARLLGLLSEYATGERCRRLEPDLAASAAGVADADQRRRVDAHLANCQACRSRVVALRRAERRLLALLPGLAGGGKLGAGAGGLASGAGLAGGAGFAGGGSLAVGGAGVGALKLGLSALCVAGLAGGGALLRGATAHSPQPRPHRAPAPAGSVHARAAGRAARMAVPAAVARVAIPGRLLPRATGSSSHPVAGAPRMSAAAREFGWPASARAATSATSRASATRLAFSAAALAPGARVQRHGATAAARSSSTPDFGFERP